MAAPAPAHVRGSRDAATLLYIVRTGLAVHDVLVTRRQDPRKLGIKKANKKANEKANEKARIEWGEVGM